eukprot:scaffold441_cov139-Skeletonema_marinoi.AAC.5
MVSAAAVVVDDDNKLHWPSAAKARETILSRGSDCDAVWFCPRRMKTPIVVTKYEGLDRFGRTPPSKIDSIDDNN